MKENFPQMLERSENVMQPHNKLMFKDGTYAKAFVAREQHLREVDCNDQIGALNAAIDAAFSEEGSRLFMTLSPGEAKLEEVGVTASGYTIFRQATTVGGYNYWSDEVGGGVLVWCQPLVSEETLRWCLRHAQAEEIPPPSPQEQQAIEWAQERGQRKFSNSLANSSTSNESRSNPILFFLIGLVAGGFASLLMTYLSHH